MRRLSSGRLYINRHSRVRPSPLVVVAAVRHRGRVCSDTELSRETAGGLGVVAV